VIDGYPSAVFDLARLLDPVLFDSVELVVTTAETLDDGVRASISEIMGCGVVEYYSASEGLPLIQQCKYGTYHVRWQTGICEVLDDAGVHCAGDGELVVTSFVQPRVPLIRYRTGDLVYGLREWSTECSCGLAGPTAEGLGGRREDTVLTRSGNRLGMFTYRTLKKIHGLGETQVVQRGLDDFLVKSVLPDAAKRQMLQAQIEESFCATLGYPVSVELCAVPRIERGAARCG
jgi:phenylacetate-coenzyme A ligase PaaK-like adenylate-forming protein